MYIFFVIIIFNYGETGKRFSGEVEPVSIVFKRNNSDSGKLFLKGGTLYLLPVLSVWWWDGERKRQIQERQVRTSKAVTGAVLRRSKDFPIPFIKSMSRYLIVFKHKMHTLHFFFSIKHKTKWDSHLLSRCSSEYIIPTNPYRNSRLRVGLLFLFCKSY